MREVEINLEGVKTIDDLHAEVSEKLNFPDYYGRNLDAMHDCLTDITEETEVVFFGVKACRSVSPEMSAYIDRMERMLEDVSTEDDNLTFILIAENKEDEEITRTAEMGREIVCERNLESIKELLSNLGIGECDCVFVSGFSGSEVIGAVRASGAKMIPVDIVPEGFGIEPRLIDFALEKIKVDGRLTPKAIILSPILGIPPRTEVVNTIAEENNLYVIFESQEQASEEDAEYLARIGDAYKMAFTLRFGKGSSRLWLPRLPKSIRPVWSGFPVRFVDPDKRDEVNKYLVESGVPARLPNLGLTAEEMDLLPVGKKVSETMLVLPVSVDMGAKDIVKVVDGIWEFFGKPEAEEDMNPFSEIADNYTEYGVR